MTFIRRIRSEGRRAAIGSVTGLLALFVWAQHGFCQFGSNASPRTDLSSDVRLDLADSETQAHLQRVEAFRKGGEWDEAVETLRRVMENRGDKLVPWDFLESAATDPPTRYVTVRRYGQRRLAAWAQQAPEALAIYRRRVDPLAERWTQLGIDGRDPEPLQRVAEQLFASSFGDDALFALGDIYLEQGRHAYARACWESICRFMRAPSNLTAPLTGKPGGPLWLALRDVSLPDNWQTIEPQLTAGESPPNWLAYPDTDLDLADIRARLILTSILEGSAERARIELEVLRRLHPKASGPMAGRTVNYFEFLSLLLDDATGWPPRKDAADWPTFAGAPSRNKIVPRGVDIAGSPIWRLELGPARTVESATPEHLDFGSKRPAEDSNRLLSFHPVVADGIALVNDESQIRAVRLATGRPWPDGSQGVLFRATRGPVSYARGSPRRVGVPRFTMTVHEEKLFARMGSPVTSYPADIDRPPVEKGYLVGLDLKRQGRLLPGFPIELSSADPENAGWFFEGAPLADSSHIYVAMRYSDVRPQAHVACYRRSTGQLKWRRLICAAETPGHGNLEEITHNLLTLHEGTIYYNTNLGTVAALRAANGGVRWITTYPRSRGILKQQGAANFYRDLNPCLCHKSWVFAAPADAEHILALDAATGQVLWQTDPDEGAHGSNSVHLLGVADDNLIVSGDRLWWIDVHTGTIRAQFPDGGSGLAPFGAADPRGFGRGLLAGNSVFWPTKDRVYVFSQQVSARGEPKMMRQPIELDVGHATRRLSGGSLLMSDGIMLLVTDKELVALSETGELPEPEPPATGDSKR